MATSGDDIEPSEEECCRAFQTCVQLQEAKPLPEADKKFGKGTAVKKALGCMKEEKMQNSCDASIMPKYQDKKSKKISDKDFVQKLIPDLAKMKLEGKAKKGTKVTDEEIKHETKSMKIKLCKAVLEPKDTKKASSSTASGVTDRLTDSSKYTGAHKERFDEEGKGKGVLGRREDAKNTGYVGDYKGEGSYGKK